MIAPESLRAMVEGEARDQRARHTGALAHLADHIEGLQPNGRRVLVMQRVA